MDDDLLENYRSTAHHTKCNNKIRKNKVFLCRLKLDWETLSLKPVCIMYFNVSFSVIVYNSSILHYVTTFLVVHMKDYSTFWCAVIEE